MMKSAKRLHAFESLESRQLLTVQMVLDVNSEDVGVNPSFVTSFKDEVYFAANAGEIPEAEIWKSDGTAEGTEFAASLGLGKIVRMGALEERLIVVVEVLIDHSHPTFSLFSTDGTQDGTIRLVEGLANPLENPYARALSPLVITDELAFIRAGFDFEAGDTHAVYSTDGTREGTQGPFGVGAFPREAVFTWSESILNSRWPSPSPPKNLVLAGDRFFFTSRDENVGTELWEIRSEPQSILFDTQRVIDLVPGPSSSSPSQLVQHDGNLFFVATEEDGVTRGVWSLAEGSSSPQRMADADSTTRLTVTDNGLLFTTLAEDDPTTSIVSGVNDSFEVVPIGTAPTEHRNLMWFADSLVYTLATDGEQPSSAGGQLLQRIADDELISVEIGQNPREFLLLDDRLFFVSNTTNGRELWTFDGNRAIEIDKPFRSGSITTDFEYFSYFDVVFEEGTQNGKAVLGYTQGAGRELTPTEDFVHSIANTLVTDGTAEGTRQVGQLNIADWTGVSTQINDQIYLIDGWLGDGSAWRLDADATLWRSSNTTAIANADERYTSINGFTVEFEGRRLTTGGYTFDYQGERQWVTALTSHGDYFLFLNAESPFSSPSYELLARRPDGGGRRVEPIFSDAEWEQLGITSLPKGQSITTPRARIFAANDLIYFVAGTEEFGDELWQSDGTVEGTKMVMDIFAGPRGSNPSILGVARDTLFFLANDGVHGQELWSITTDEAISDPKLLGDLDENGTVDFADFLAFSQDFGRKAEDNETLRSDLDASGSVDFADFLLLSESFGKSQA